jgi:uncharacterized protein YbjT (DUF2867 family)
MEEAMKVLVIGATGGSGRATVGELLERGHTVTAFCRSADAFTDGPEELRLHVGDALNADDVSAAVRAQDAVVVTLGIRENPVRVRLGGPTGTSAAVRSEGTRNVIAAMRAHGVRRLVVQTSYGSGVTRGRLPLRYRLMFWVLLRPQVLDTEKQDELVRASGLDWVLAQPVNLTDVVEGGTAFASAQGDVQGWHVSRNRVGRFLAQALEGETFVGRTVALS